MAEPAILCVDDEAIILLALKEELKRRFGDRFIYHTARNAEDALVAIENLTKDNVHVSIVISDWLMPGMTGDELLAEVHKRWPGIATIMLTGMADDQAIETAKKTAGLKACLRKPWAPHALFSAVESCFAN